jgi:hypothetical protein
MSSQWLCWSNLPVSLAIPIIAENLVENFHIKFTQKEKKPKLQILSARLESLRYVNYAFKTGMASDTK